MINRWPIFDDNDESGWISTISAFWFVRACFWIENAAGMDGLRHGDGHFAVCNLDFSTDTHDAVSFRLLRRKIHELYQIGRKLGIANERRTRFFRDGYRITHMIPVSVCD